MRVVTAYGWPYKYRAHVVRHQGLFRDGWRFVIEQKWTHWDYHSKSGIFKTEAEAEAAASRWLDAHDEDLIGERSYV